MVLVPEKETNLLKRNDLSQLKRLMDANEAKT